MEMKYKKYCQQCNNLIPKKSESWVRYNRKRFCSNYCQTQSLKIVREIGECIICNKRFKYNKGQQTGKYCSQKCFHQKYKNGKNIKCEICKKIFYRKSANIKKHKHYFCSPACQLKWQKKKKIISECTICKKRFKHPKSHNRITCSDHCKGVSSCIKQYENKGLNKLELKGREILNNIGLGFNEQVLLFNKFLVDVVLKNKNIVIQWDGRYWHNKVTVKQRDKSQDAYMKKRGYKVLRFWEDEVYENPEKIKEKIYEAI